VVLCNLLKGKEREKFVRSQKDEFKNNGGRQKYFPARVSAGKGSFFSSAFFHYP